MKAQQETPHQTSSIFIGQGLPKTINNSQHNYQILIYLRQSAGDSNRTDYQYDRRQAHRGDENSNAIKGSCNKRKCKRTFEEVQCF